MRCLNDLKIGEIGIVKCINNIGTQRRLFELGFIKGQKVKLVLKNFGDSMRAYQVKGTVIAIRKSLSKDIIIF